MPFRRNKMRGTHFSSLERERWLSITEAAKTWLTLFPRKAKSCELFMGSWSP
jgi:hypothetical protein